jgi:hypothetical protein
MWLVGCEGVFGTKYKVINTINEVLPIVAEAKKEGEVIVFFNIDQTLTRPNSPLLTLKNRTAHKDILRDVKRGLSQCDILLDIAAAVSFPQVLIDQDAPEVIRKIQAQGITCWGYTSFITGAFDDIPSLEDWRSQELVKLGIAFSSISEQGVNFQSTSLHRNFLFKNGIIFTDNKRTIYIGYVIRSFFRYLSSKGKLPKVVVMVDSTLYSLRHLQNSLQYFRPTIHYIGVQYVNGLRDEDPVSDPEAFRELMQRLIIKVLKAQS